MSDPPLVDMDGGDRFEVPASLAGERIDRAVALLTGYSRADVQALLAEGGVLLDGAAVSKSRRLEEGDVVDVVGRPVPPSPPGPEPVDVPVRHVDADVIVVAKPAGLVVHPGAGNEHGTLVHGLLAAYPEIAGVGDAMRPGIVHRLDRDTSGLMVVARSAAAYDALVTALSSRAVERRYLALAWGHFEASRGVIDAPVGRSPRHRTRMAVTPSGREARTRYDVREEFGDPAVTVVECALDTGRTHQIRVHLAAVDHPVVGDAVYGGKRQSLAVPRAFLHSFALAFDHPVTGARMTFEEPLPADLQEVLDRLRR